MSENAIIAIVVGFMIGLGGWLAIDAYILQGKQDVSSTSTVSITKTNQTNLDEYLEHINDLRADAELEPLRINDKLNASAQHKADHMQANDDYWSHDAPDGTEPWHFFRLAEYSYTKAGENLARCYSSPMSTVTAWYNSPDHRDNMLGEYTEIGFGEYDRGDGCTVVVSHYGKR